MRTEKEITDLFTRQFGIGLLSRFMKLDEEHGELHEAYNRWIREPTEANRLHVVEELSDTVAVAAHIASIMGLNTLELLNMADDKVRGRMANPNYKR